MITSTSAMACSTRRNFSTPRLSTYRGSSVGGPQTRTCIPIFCMAKMFERATRLCRMSPTMATLSPSRFGRRSRIVNRSSRACVGCSCAPSPALMMDALSQPRQEVRRPGHRVPDHHHVRVHGLQGEAGVLQALPFHHAARRGRDVDDVGAQPLARDLERGPRPRAGLVEQVDDRLAAQRRHLLDVPGGDLLHRGRRVQNEADLLDREFSNAQQVLALQPHRTPPDQAHRSHSAFRDRISIACHAAPGARPRVSRPGLERVRSPVAS